MSEPRLAAHVEVSALLRQVAAGGGNGAVLARGDAEGGAILLLLCDRGEVQALLERTLDPAGHYHWGHAGPSPTSDRSAADSYIERRRRVDRDLWVVELDGAAAEQFGADRPRQG